MYDYRFNYAVAVVLEHEGGLTDNPKDPGGITNFGITLPFLKDNGIDINGNGIINTDTIKKLTKNQAIEIYYKYFWLRYNYPRLNSVEIPTKILDMSVNMGAGEAHKILQRSLNDLVYKPAWYNNDAFHQLLTIDGVLGLKTISMANNCDHEKLHEQLRINQKQFYENLVNDKPLLQTFLDGWLKRSAW